MENKTISYLRSKTWYRLIKVLYVTFFVVFMFYVFGSIYDNNRKVPADFFVTCNYGNGSSFFAFKQMGIRISEKEFKNGVERLSNEVKDQLGNICKITNEEYEYVFEQVLANNFNVKELYTLTQTQKEEGGSLVILLKFLRSFLVFGILFEVIRRAFYYVSLGTFRPKK